MRERTLEEKLVRQAKALGGTAYKFVSPGIDGVPDRLVLLPGGRMAFVEVKAPGQKLRPLQTTRKRQIEKMGFNVYVLDDPAEIGGILYEIEHGV